MKHDLGALAFGSMIFLVTFVLIATAEHDLQLLSGGAAALGLFAAFYGMFESYLWLMTRRRGKIGATYLRSTRKIERP